MCWEDVSTPLPELDFLKNWAYHTWLLRGRLNLVVLGRGLMLFEFELLSEAERVLAKGKRRVKDNVLFLEKWYPKVGCFCNGANANKDWVRVVGLPLHLWNCEVFKLIGDGCGGFFAVDENTNSMAELQWARSLVKLVGRDLPTFVQIVVGSGSFSIHLWWETLPWYSQVVPAGRLLGEGVSTDEDEAGGRPRAACSGSVLEKEFQSKVQTGVQDVSSFGSFSKSAIGFSSDSSTGGIGLEAIVGEESLGNRGQGVGGVVRVGAQCFGPKELKIGPILWEAHNRSGPGEVSLKPVLAEAQLQGVESEPRPFLLKGCLVGCEERPFLLKGSLVDCEESFGVGFGPRVVGLKEERALYPSAFAETEARASEEASRAQDREDKFAFSEGLRGIQSHLR